MNHNDYFIKYKKYKKKYLQIKKIINGGKVKECKGDAIVRGGIFESKISAQDVYDHYGNCYNQTDFVGFNEINKDNNITVIDLIKVGFSYEQILKSGIESQYNLNNIIWINRNDIELSFIAQALRDGYVSLLSERKNDSELETPMFDFDDIVKMIELAFSDETMSESYRYNLAKNIIIKMNKFDKEEIKNIEYEMKPVWETFEKYNIYQANILKYIN